MSDQITISLPDGSERSLATGTTGADLAASIGRRLADAAVAITVDGEERDLATALGDGNTVSIITGDSDAGRHVLRHSTSHVLAQAVTRLYPGATYAIGPAIADGFYYDFELVGGVRFSADDLTRIEGEMRSIMAEAQPFERGELPIAEGRAMFEALGQPFKVEIIDKVSAGAKEAAGDAAELAGDTVSYYRNSPEFVDMCRGPHVPNTGKLGHFKLMRVAAAYWRGDEKRDQLQRIYGTAWESRKALAEHLNRLEEAAKRDHRKLGVELDLFSFPDEIGSGLAVFHPKGGLIRRLMEDYSRRRHEAAGYEFVNTPHITKAALFEKSGHLDFFADGMFPPMEVDADEDGHGAQQYYLKPMNCPMHNLIFDARLRSYRELPLRLFEFGSVYRYEKSGVVHGLTRVRGMTQDDSHIYTTKEGMAEELASLLDFVLSLLSDFGLDDFYLELSTRPPDKAIGSDEDWEEATEALRAVAVAKGLELVLDEGGGAFYGPKISVQARDAIGRTWQMSTIQVDFQGPQRFNLTYVGADNQRHQPIMIHRALFGSIERFFAVLVEHYAGAFPTWLSPVQVSILPVADDHADYAWSLLERLKTEGFRAEVVGADEALGGRIRKTKMAKVPHIVVVGGDDVAAGTVADNVRGAERPEKGIAVEDFIERLRTETKAYVSR